MKVPDKKEEDSKLAKKHAKEEKPPPHVTAVNVGSMGHVIDGPVEVLREKNPDKEYRYVYAPEHKSDYSKLIKRKAQGYVPVDAEEVGHIHGEAGSQVRVGDVILCEIAKEKKEARRAELAERAQEDARRSQVVFEESVRRTRKRGHGTAPVGSVERSTREYSVEMED